MDVTMDVTMKELRWRESGIDVVCGCGSWTDMDHQSPLQRLNQID